MSVDATLLSVIWDIVRDHLPERRRDEIALAMVHSFIDHGFDLADLAVAGDEDPDLSDALDYVRDEDGEADAVEEDI